MEGANLGLSETKLEPITVSIKTGCRITGLGATKIFELIRLGTIESVKVGHRRLLNYQSLKRLLGQTL